MNTEIIKSKPVSIVALILIYGCIFHPVTLGVIHIMLMSLFFILYSLFFLIVVLVNDLFGLLRLKSAKLLGEVSYSVYLLHGLVLYLLFTQLTVFDFAKSSQKKYLLLMPVVSLVVVLVSSVTFILIEKKFIDLGRRYLLSLRLLTIIENTKKYFNAKYLNKM